MKYKSNKKLRKGANGKERKNASFMDRRLPTYHSNGDRDTTNRIAEHKGGIYEIYKKATEAFVDWVKASRPKKASSKFTVTDLAERAVQIDTFNLELNLDADQQPIVAPAEVMRDLEVSIQYRQIMAGKHGDHEEGHAYFIDVLRRFRKVLRRGQRVVRIINYQEDEDSKERDETTPANRFGHLTVDDDEDDENEETEGITIQDLRQRVIPAVTIPEAPARVPSLEDLIAGSDRMQAVALLLSMESLMEQVDSIYRTLKAKLQGDIAQVEASVMELLLECGMLSNYATISVKMMENSLQLDHPHLSTCFHILSIVFLKDLIHKCNCLMQPTIREGNPYIGLDFVADVMEATFCRQNYDERRLNRFSKQSGIPISQLYEIHTKVHQVVLSETMTDLEERVHSRRPGMPFCRNRLWMSDKTFIGKNRNIINTMCITQRAFQRVSGEGRLVGNPGAFGPPFDEHFATVHSIRGDLDDPFASEILPEIIGLGKWAPFRFLPELDRLAPTLDLLSDQSKLTSPKPIKFALAFGLHSMLTSIFVVQGDLEKLAVASKKSFHKLFDQWKGVLDRSNGGPEHSPNFYKDLSKFVQTQNFGIPIPTVGLDRAPTKESTELIALWNPFIGSQYLLFATFMCSIGVGSAMVDDIGQLRTTLHLYNALQTTGLLSAPIPFLEMLVKAFKGMKHLWATREPPSKGSFVKEYLLSFGASIDVANKLSSVMLMDGKARNKARLGRCREVDNISPQDFCESYPQLVMADFSPNSAENAEELVRRNEDREDFSVFLSQVRMTQASMRKDEESAVLKVNFPIVSDILLRFVVGLTERLDWGPKIADIVSVVDRKNSPHVRLVAAKHQAIVQLVSREVLAKLDKDGRDKSCDEEDNEIEQDGENVKEKICRDAGDYVVTYFEGISDDQYTYLFQPNS